MNRVHLQETRLTTGEERKEKQDYLMYCSSHFILGSVENSVACILTSLSLAMVIQLS